LKIKLAPEGAPLTRISYLIPAPDDFRLLYCVNKGKGSEIWAILPDGTKASRVYMCEGEISALQWTPDAQQVVFEETVPGKRHFFRDNVKNIQVLNVNIGTFTTLILPKVEHRSPAVSPESAKVAFLGSQGLWYPTLSWSPRSTLWVAVIR
jgi:Tol biopolymer transport system component